MITHHVFSSYIEAHSTVAVGLMRSVAARRRDASRREVE
jgi:hypothetical protein